MRAATTISRVRAAAACMALATAPLSACSAQEGGEPAPAPRARPPASAAGGACGSIGPLACSVPPAADPATGACDALTSCLSGRESPAGNVIRAAACEPPVFAGGGGPRRAAAVGATLDVDGPPSHAAYLFVEADGGWCPSAELLAPEWDQGGYCDTRFEASWSEGRRPATAMLVTLAERVCHTPLDQAEIAAGESDVAFVECRRATYAWDDGALRLVAETASDGPCPEQVGEPGLGPE